MLLSLQWYKIKAICLYIVFIYQQFMTNIDTQYKGFLNSKSIKFTKDVTSVQVCTPNGKIQTSLK